MHQAGSSKGDPGNPQSLCKVLPPAYSSPLTRTMLSALRWGSLIRRRQELEQDDLELSRQIERHLLFGHGRPSEQRKRLLSVPDQDEVVYGGSPKKAQLGGVVRCFAHSKLDVIGQTTRPATKSRDTFVSALYYARVRTMVACEPVARSSGT